MAEPWIRVHANLGGKPVTFRASEQLKVSENEAIGLLVRFWGSMSQLGDNGHVDRLTDTQIESWAGWRGKRGKFAAFIRGTHTDAEGRVNDWDEYAGKLEDRRAKDRDRKHNERERRRMSRGSSVAGHADVPSDGPRDVRKESQPTRANETKRDETIRDEQRSSTQKDPKGGTNNANPSADAPPAGSAPPARALDLSQLPRESVEFVVRYYPRGRVDPKRRREVVDQLIATLSDGARYKGGLVRAINAGRLAAKCREVMREGVRDPNAAIVVLLAKLADSSDYTDEQRQKDHVERESEQRVTIQETLAAEQWLIERPDIATSIDEQLETAGLPAVELTDDDEAEFTRMARAMMRGSLLVRAWRAAGNAEHVGAGT